MLSLRPLIILVALTACQAPTPTPQPVVEPRSACGSTCNSNIECGFGFPRSCPFCNFGTCRSTRPESLKLDAGVPDAP